MNSRRAWLTFDPVSLMVEPVRNSMLLRRKVGLQVRELEVDKSLFTETLLLRCVTTDATSLLQWVFLYL